MTRNFEQIIGPKFNKLANPPENGSNSLQHMEEYKGSSCEDEASCRVTDPSLDDGQGMFVWMKGSWLIWFWYWCN